jgi:dihydrofolate reductase
MGQSIDGFMAGPDGDLSWHQVDEELHQHFNDVLAEADAFLEGRVTFELMADHWPTADEQEGASPAERQFARIWRDTPRIVYSRTLEAHPWATRILREVDPDEVRALKEEGDGELVLGGRELTESFFAHDLVDELRVYVHPVLVGDGARSFGSVPLGVWRLFETRTFSNGVVLLRYRRP